jgi:hypothetical protein
MNIYGDAASADMRWLWHASCLWSRLACSSKHPSFTRSGTYGRRQLISRLGKTVGSPWTHDEKTAALAGLILCAPVVPALRHRSRNPFGWLLAGARAIKATPMTTSTADPTRKPTR